MLNANATRRESEDLTIVFGVQVQVCSACVSVCVVGGKVDWIGEKVEGFYSLYHLSGSVGRRPSDRAVRIKVAQTHANIKNIVGVQTKKKLTSYPLVSSAPHAHEYRIHFRNKLSNPMVQTRMKTKKNHFLLSLSLSLFV